MASAAGRFVGLRFSAPRGCGEMQSRGVNAFGESYGDGQPNASTSTMREK